MSPIEFRDAIRRLADEIGPRAEIYSTIGLTAGLAVRGMVYVDGMSQGLSFSEEANEFDALVEKLTAKWAIHKEAHERQFVRKLALRIIEITAEFGECTDAALRSHNFRKEDLIRYGERACDDADEIAGRGPFKLRMLGGSNNAPIDKAA